MEIEPEYFLLNVKVSFEEFAAAMREITRAFNRLNKAYRRAQQEPWPLCINGQEYRRRQRRRTKRKQKR